MQPNQKYYIEQNYTMLVEHGLENIVRQSLELNEAIKIIDGENGSGIIILRKNEKN